jgi:succinoglycan biosynthesis transport protein ExoP
LARGWWIILLTTVVATGAAVSVSLRQQRLYTASAQVLLSNQNLATALSNVVVPSTDPARVAQTQADLARVPTVAQKTLASLGLTKRTPDELLSRSSVSASSSADLLTFRVTDPDRALAAALATAYARQYTAYRLQLDTASLARARRQVSTQLARLAQQGKRGSTLYDSLLEKDQQLATIQALQTSNASVVRTADHAALTQPRTVRNGLLGFMLGLLLGVGLAFLRDALDTRVRSVERLQQLLDLPLLARIPEPPRPVRKRDGLVMLEGPESREAEPYRILAVNIDFANMERHARSIMFTSAQEKEGKSTTVSNLAIAFARSGRRVALVDLDLRSPYLYRFFGLDGRAGITQVGLGLVRLDHALVPVPLVDSRAQGKRSSDGNGAVQGLLEVVPSGPTPPSPGEFAHSSTLGNILGELVERSDLVLVDAPPLLGVGDAVAVSAHVDAMVVVSRLPLQRTPVVSELQRVLAACLAPPIGFVATDAEVDDQYLYSGYVPPLSTVRKERDRAT